MPATHTSYGRTTRSKKPSRKVITLRPTPSLVSLVSSFTQKSNGSSGSNSTVTPESVSRGKARRARSPRSEMERRSSMPPPSSPREHVGHGFKPSSSIPAVEEPSSVLAYCEEDPEGINEQIELNMIKAQEEEALQRAEEESSRHGRYIEGGEPNTPHELEAYDPRRQHYNHHHHHHYPIGAIPEMGVVTNKPSSLYDSGISIRSSSPEPRDSPVQQKTRRLLGKAPSSSSKASSSKALTKAQQGKKAVKARDAERKPRLPEAPMPPSREPSPITVYVDPPGHGAEAPGYDGYHAYGADPRLHHPSPYQQHYAHHPSTAYPPEHHHSLRHHADAPPSLDSQASSSSSSSASSASASDHPSPNDAAAATGSHLPPKAGYDALVARLSSRACPFSDQTATTTTTPVYRKFEALQNYRLLHLQDEIAEAEAHLDRLNAYLGAEARLGGQACSRRMDDRVGDQLHWEHRRVHDFVFAKVEEYNQALTSYHALASTLAPASGAHIASYKAVLADLSPPLHAPERAFIDAADADLVAISAARRPSPSYATSGRAPGRLSPPATAAALLALIVAFKMVPPFLSRLVVGAVGGFALVGPEVAAAWRREGWEGGLKRVAVPAVAVVVLACFVG